MAAAGDVLDMDLHSLAGREVSVVVTHVEGSSAIRAWRADIMAEAVLQHDGLLQRLMLELGAIGVVTELDSAVVVFQDAASALRWCLDVQEALLAVPWPEGLGLHPAALEVWHEDDAAEAVAEPATAGQLAGNRQLLFRGLRVQMGVCTGRLCADAGSWEDLEPTRSLAETIASAAVGGQILMCETTAQRYNDGVPMLGGLPAENPPGNDEHPLGPPQQRPNNQPAPEAAPPGPQLNLQRSISPSDTTSSSSPTSSGTGSAPSSGPLRTPFEGVVLIDMGRVDLGRASLRQGASTDTALQVRIMLVVAVTVQNRLMHWPSTLLLPHLTPSYFDAPATLPSLSHINRSIPAPLRPHVTLIHCSLPVDLGELMAVLGGAAVLQQFGDVVRVTLEACGGYECQESRGTFILAFRTTRQGLEWGLTLQMALSQVRLDRSLEALLGAPVSPEARRSISHARIGLMSGEVTRVSPHPRTGRADYFSPLLHRTARLHGAAQGGHVLAEATATQLALQEWRELLVQQGYQPTAGASSRQLNLLGPSTSGNRILSTSARGRRLSGNRPTSPRSRRSSSNHPSSVARVPVAVEVHDVGRLAFRGVDTQFNITMLISESLPSEYRLFPPPPPASRTNLVTAGTGLMDRMVIFLPDVTQLQLQRMGQ